MAPEGRQLLALLKHRPPPQPLAPAHEIPRDLSQAWILPQTLSVQKLRTCCIRSGSTVAPTKTDNDSILMVRVVSCPHGNSIGGRVNGNRLCIHSLRAFRTSVLFSKKQAATTCMLEATTQQSSLRPNVWTGSSDCWDCIAFLLGLDGVLLMGQSKSSTIATIRNLQIQ